MSTADATADVTSADEVRLRRFARESVKIVDGLSEEQVRLLLGRLILAVRVWNSDPDMAGVPRDGLWQLTRFLYADVTEDQALTDALADGLDEEMHALTSAVVTRFRELLPET